METTVLVTGGTGTLGQCVVPALLTEGKDVRMVGRRDRGPGSGTEYVKADLGEKSSVGAVADALSDVSTVVHLAGSAKGDDVKTRHLLEAIREAGTHPHLVYISVVGADRTPVVSAVDHVMFGYVKAKRDSEELVIASGLPWSILRASQFHNLAADLARSMARMPVALVPSGTRMQPVDGGEVADRLVEIAVSEPTGRVEEMAGPRVYGLDEIVRSYFRAIGRRRPIVAIRLPGKAAAAFRAGANLSPERAVGRRTWEDFLADTATVLARQRN